MMTQEEFIYKFKLWNIDKRTDISAFAAYLYEPAGLKKIPLYINSGGTCIFKELRRNESRLLAVLDELTFYMKYFIFVPATIKNVHRNYNDGYRNYNDGYHGVLADSVIYFCDANVSPKHFAIRFPSNCGICDYVHDNLEDCLSYIEEENNKRRSTLKHALASLQLCLEILKNLT